MMSPDKSQRADDENDNHDAMSKTYTCRKDAGVKIETKSMSATGLPFLKLSSSLFVALKRKLARAKSGVGDDIILILLTNQFHIREIKVVETFFGQDLTPNPAIH